MGKQPTQGQKKTKDAIAKAASSRSKTTKKKWTKGRNKDKLNNAVFLDAQQYKQIDAQVSKLGSLVTVSVLSDKFKINGSLARKVLKHFETKGVLVPVGDQHNSQYIYTVSAQVQADQKAAAAAQAEQQKATGKKGKK
ncbi:hypothetical protein pb186bvf_018471 [Paramecium bursaria]